MSNIRKAQIFVALLVIFVCGAMSHAQSTADGALSITNLIVSPSTIVAGGNVTINFQLYDSYTSALNNVNIQLESSSQIVNVSPSSSYIVDSIGEGIYGGVGYDTFTYKFHIPSTLQAGEYTFDVVANYEVNSGTETEAASSTIPIEIYVYGTPQVSLTAVPTNQIIPGEEFGAEISAVNGGTDTARNLSVTLFSSNSFEVVGATKFSLGTLAAGSDAVADATLQPSLNITSGVYNLDALESYTEQSGNFITKNVSIPISVVINQPNIVLSVVSSTPSSLYPGANQTITLDVENTGIGEAKNVSVRFVGDDQIGIGSSSSFFIGTLMPSSLYAVTVFVSANRYDNQTSYNIPVIISYSSSNLLNTTSVTRYLPIELKPTAIFNITSSSGVLKAGDTYKPITFTIRNIGNEPAEQIALSLQTIYPITPSNPNAYINSLNPGESANITFYVDVDSQGYSGSYPITIYEQWSQPNGYTSQQYSSSTNYYSNIGTVGAATSSKYEEIIVILAVVIVIGAIVGIARRRRKKKSSATKGK